METTCVILAAGLSRRFGSNKLLERAPGGTTLLERALRACEGFPVVAVAIPETAAALRDSRATVLLNHEPDRGMSYSLKVANAEIDPAHAIAVLPADLALIASGDVTQMVSALGENDVVFPIGAKGVPGHPVVFSPRARAEINALHDGDTIHDLRDDARLRRCSLSCESAGHFTDVDTPSDLVGLV